MKSQKAEDAYLAINQCPTHGWFAICLEDAEGSGHRLTPSKCCGSWKTIKRWKVDPEELIQDIKRAT